MKDAIEQRLAQLEPLKRGGQTRVIRARYDAIEAALARGVTRQQIVELLAEEGVTISLPFFKNILHRIRQDKKRNDPSLNTPANPPESVSVTKDDSAAKQPTTDAWNRIDQIAKSAPDLQALRRQHLDSLKRERK